MLYEKLNLEWHVLLVLPSLYCVNVDILRKTVQHQQQLRKACVKSPAPQVLTCFKWIVKHDISMWESIIYSVDETNSWDEYVNYVNLPVQRKPNNFKGAHNLNSDN